MTHKPRSYTGFRFELDDDDPNYTALIGYFPEPLPEGFQFCEVYWGSHGCHLELGHEGTCECECCECENHPDPNSGCVAKAPYYGPDTKFYGAGVERLGLPREDMDE